MEGVGEGVEAGGLEVVIHEESGVAAGSAFIEDLAAGVGQLIGEGDFKSEFFRAEDILGRGAGLAVGEVIEGDAEGGVGFTSGGEAVGAVLHEGIDQGIRGEGFDTRKDDAAGGERDVDGIDGL